MAYNNSTLSGETPDDDGEFGFAPTNAAEVAALVAVWRDADRMATDLLAALRQAGLTKGLVVLPTLTAAGQPVVQVRMTADAAMRLGDLLSGQGRPPPPARGEKPPAAA
jgi:hypothetical protein